MVSGFLLQRENKHDKTPSGFGILLLIFYLSSYFAVNVNRETQAFIQAMLQREGVCAVTKPIRAFPRGDYLRNTLGNTCEGFLVPDICDPPYDNTSYQTL